MILLAFSFFFFKAVLIFQTGTNLVNITVHKKQEVTVREVGGSMGPIWPNYYKNANAIMVSVCFIIY